MSALLSEAYRVGYQATAVDDDKRVRTTTFYQGYQAKQIRLKHAKMGDQTNPV